MNKNLTNKDVKERFLSAWWKVVILVWGTLFVSSYTDKNLSLSWDLQNTNFKSWVADLESVPRILYAGFYLL